MVILVTSVHTYISYITCLKVDRMDRMREWRTEGLREAGTLQLMAAWL
jgi:hypothetical protein